MTKNILQPYIYLAAFYGFIWYIPAVIVIGAMIMYKMLEAGQNIYQQQMVSWKFS